MTSRLAADRRIRAAALAVPGLDIRGPVSQALARAGVAVPPLADASDEAAELAPSTAPTRPASRPEASAAPRVVKPFAEAPWPTRKATADPRAVLSGLTTDERRVHRILLDTLALQSQHGGGTGLSYAETQKLAVLDLAFIDAEIAEMDRGTSMSPRATRLALAVGAGLTALAAGVLLLAGEGEAALFVSLMTGVALLAAVGLASLLGNPTSAATPRRKIYDALRELALLADPEAVTSDALRQADAVIDRLAGADASSRPGPLPDAPAATTGAEAIRTRTRS